MKRSRRARSTEGQNPLALPCDPAGEDALRRAFAGSGLQRHGYSFERAIRTPAIRICLGNVARVLVRK